MRAELFHGGGQTDGRTAIWTNVQKRRSYITKIQQDATVCRYLFTAKLLYMFWVSSHPSSGVHKTVISVSGKGKGKSVPLQAWSGSEGSRKLRFPDFMTTAQEGGKVVSRRHRLHLPPENSPSTHFC